MMREIIAAAVVRPDFHNALLAVAGARGGNIISNDRLGRWLKANEGKIVNGLSLVRDGMVHGYPLWRLMDG
jgi:putative DNA primase/helicase